MQDDLTLVERLNAQNPQSDPRFQLYLRLRAQTPVTAGEQLREFDYKEMLPVAGAGFTAKNAWDLHRAAQAYGAGTATREQALELVDHVRPRTFGADVTSIGQGSIGFMGDIAVSGGVGAGLRAGVKAAAPKVAAKMGTKVGKAVTTLGALEGVTRPAQEALLPEGGRVSAAEARMATRIGLDDAGLLTAQVDDVSDYRTRALMDTAIEDISEFTGGLVAGPAAKLALKTTIGQWWAKKTGGTIGKFFRETADKVKWNNIAGEWFEEQVGAAARGATSVLPEDKRLSEDFLSAFPDLRENAAMIAAFSMFPIAGGGISMAANALGGRGQVDVDTGETSESTLDPALAATMPEPKEDLAPEPLATPPAGQEVEATEEELMLRPTEDLDREAFGFTSGDVVEVDPARLDWEDADLENAEYQRDQFPGGSEAWARSVDMSEPIDVSYSGGRFLIEDGHHRSLAAETLGEPLRARVDVKDNPVLEILRKRDATPPPVSGTSPDLASTEADSGAEGPERGPEGAFRTVAQGVKELGGIDLRGLGEKNEAGDFWERLKRREQGKAGFPAGMLYGPKSKAKAKGLPPELMVQALQEAGFEVDGTDGLLEALENELAGNPTLHPGDVGGATEAARQEDLERGEQPIPEGYVEVGSRAYPGVPKEEYTREEHKIARIGQTFGTKVRFVETDDFAGVSLRPGEVVLRRGDNASRYLWHELTHDLSRRTGSVEALIARVLAVDAQGLRKAHRRDPGLWRAYGRTRGREETMAAHAEGLAAYLELLGSKKGARHLKRLMRTERGLVEKILDALRAIGAKVFGGEALTRYERDLAEATEMLRTLDPEAAEADAVSLKVAELIRRAMESGMRAEAGETADLDPRFADVWHGTGADLGPGDEFRDDKIGTGEGAQAYGHGHYFASRKGVAEWYKESLAADGVRLPDGRMVSGGSSGAEGAVASWVHGARSWDEAITQAAAVADASVVAQLEAWRDAGAEITSGGSLLKVTLAPKETEYLLWDEPLSGQSEEVRAALTPVIAELPEPRNQPVRRRRAEFLSGDGRAESVYRSLANQLGSNRAASQALLAAGIRGIKYLDGQSRNKPLRDLRKSFLAALPEDAEFEEVVGLVGTGHFTPQQDAVIQALDTEGWMGFDYPSQAISAALGGSLENYDPSPELLSAIKALRTDATHNYVLFDPADAKIEARFAPMPAEEKPKPRKKKKAGKKSKGKKIAERLLAPEIEENRWTKFVEEYVDKGLPAKQVVDIVSDMAGMVPDTHDPYMASLLSRGKQRDVARRLRLKYINPMSRRLRAAKISVEDAGMYLIARHARERTQWFVDRQAAGEDLGREFDHEENNAAGMPSAEADALADEYEGKHDAYAEVGKLYDQMNAYLLDMRRDWGLISEKVHEELSDRWKHYAPLQTSEEGSSFPARSKGFTVRGPEWKKAKGRTSLPDNPYVFAQVNAWKAIERSINNDVTERMVRLLRENQGVIGTEVREVPQEEVEEALRTGRRVQLPEDTFSYKKDGKQVEVKVASAGLARAMKNLDAPVKGPFLRRMSQITRTLASLYTSYNPEFILFSNPQRDTQTALVNALALAPKDAKGVGRKIVKGAPKAAAAVFRGVEESRDDAWGQAYEEASQLGALSSGVMVQRDYEHSAKEIAREVERGNIAEAFAKTLEAFDRVADSTENALRLSAYRVFRDMKDSEGNHVFTKEKAALAAKEITLNFDRVGSMTSTIGSFKAFFNAGMQGARQVLLHSRSPRVARRLAALGAISAMTAVMNRIIGGDDEDGVPKWDRIPAHIKERNYILMLPGGYSINLPMPWGFGAIHAAATSAADMVAGEQTSVGDATAMTASALMSGLSPVNPGPLPQMVSPTALAPAVQVWTNQAFYGAPLMPGKSRYGRDVPDSERSWATSPEAFRAAARWLNDLTGGDEFESGSILGMDASISPETLEATYDAYTGGMGRILKDSLRLAATPFQDWKASRTPFLRKFVREANEWSMRADYYEALEELDALKARRGGIEGKDPVRAKDEALLPLLEEYRAGKNNRGLLTQARDAMKSAREAEGSDERNRFEAEAQKAMTDFLAKYRAARSQE